MAVIHRCLLFQTDVVSLFLSFPALTDEPTGRVPGADPVRVGDAGDGADVCGEEETSGYDGEFIHVGGGTQSVPRLLTRTWTAPSPSSSSTDHRWTADVRTREPRTPAADPDQSPAARVHAAVTVSKPAVM